MTRATPLVLTVLLMGAVPATAAAAKPASGLRLLASGVRVFASDGQRYVAWQRGRDVKVIDTKSRRRYATTAAAGCSMVSGPAAHILSFPELLVECGTRTIQLDLLNLLTGSLMPLPAGQPWEAVGRLWVEGSQAGPCPTAPGSCEPYYQWHTRVTKYVPVAQLNPGGLPPQTPMAFVAPQYLGPDLDSAGLTIAPPCTPYGHQSLTNGRYSYDPPYVLVANAPPTAAQVLSGHVAIGVELGRCGSSSTMTLGRRPYDAELSARNLSWAEGTAAYDYDIATRMTRRWPVPGARASFSPPVTALHTRYAVIAAKTTRESCSQLCVPLDVDLYLAPLPS